MSTVGEPAAAGRWVHIDPVSGVSADLLLGALVDLGVDPDEVRAVLAGINVGGWELDVAPGTSHGLAGMSATVRCDATPVVRTWPHIRALLQDAGLPPSVGKRALGTFERLATAEARLQHTEPDRVHLSEHGIDALVGIVAVCAAFHLAAAERISCGPVPQGVGMTRAGQGMRPIPAPVVLELLRGAPVYSTGLTGELCTPIGAALLAELADAWGELPGMVVEAVGYGTGPLALDRPHVLRLIAGRPTPVPSDAAGLLDPPSGASPPRSA